MLMMQPWWINAKMYELYVDKFAGNFRNLTERLDYFGHLGINTLHILPHYPSPMVDDGYDVSDYRAVRPELGTMDDFSAFTAAAHVRGIRIIIDFALNHVSEQHPWFVEARASKENSTRGFFIWSESKKDLPNESNAFKDFKTSNWIRNDATGDYYYATFYPQQPDLNWRNPGIIAEMSGILDFWVEAGADGFRLDAIPFLVEDDGMSPSRPAIHAAIAALRAHLDERHGARVALLGEVNSRSKESAAYFGADHECQLVYNFQLTVEMFLALVRRDRSRLDGFVRDAFDALPPYSQWATFLRNHDDLALGTLDESERRELIRFFDPTGRYIFNKGEGVSIRLGTAFKNEPERVIEAYELLYSLPGAPILYYGDEIGMQNLKNGDFTDTRRYVRGPFDWSVAESMLADPHSPLSRIARLIHDHHGVR